MENKKRDELDMKGWTWKLLGSIKFGVRYEPNLARENNSIFNSLPLPRDADLFPYIVKEN